MTEVLTPRFMVWEFNQSLNWWVEGFFGAVNVQAVRLPDIPGIEEPARALHWVRVDGGWLFGSDVGRHHRFAPEDPEAWIYFDACLMLEKAECWYTGSALQAEAVIEAWAASQFDDGLIFAFLEDLYMEEFG